jgi:peptidoglycan/xylan/chitin deacetylase (PgdA/CDA1 family)
MRFASLAGLLLLSIFASSAAHAGARVAITVDDLPVHMTKPPNITRTEILRAFIATFREKGIARVWGFVNGHGLEEDPSAREGLEDWVHAGHRLGNHTWSHLSLVENPVAVFLADARRNEPLLAELTGAEGFRYFRYPYMDEGNTLTKRDQVRAWLRDQGYGVAQVTIDFGDWAWNDPYTRCVAKGDQKTIAWMEQAYLDAGLDRLRLAQETSQLLFGRDIPHVLLSHAGVFGSRMIGRLIDSWRAQGVEFVSLEAAQADSIYAQNPNVANQGGMTLLKQWLQARGLQAPRPSVVPLDALEAACR